MVVDELRIYKIAVQLRNELHSRINLIPRNWSIKCVSQARRSSSSVPSNIAEGFSRRFYRKDFVHYLVIALGSSDETQNHIQELYDDGHFNKDDVDYFLKHYTNLSVRILNYINYQRKKFLIK